MQREARSVPWGLTHLYPKSSPFQRSRGVWPWGVSNEDLLSVAVLGCVKPLVHRPWELS